MAENLNILLDAAVELGKLTGVNALDNKYLVTGITKDGNGFTLRLEIFGGNDVS